MPAAEAILTNDSFTRKGDKYDYFRSPRPKRSKHGKHKHLSRKQDTTTNLGHPTLCVLSKPENGVINGKNRHRFPDPSQDKHVLLGIFDNEQTLFKLHYIDEHGICMDDTLEKEILKHPLSQYYFIKLEQIQIDLASGESEIKTEYSNKNIICAKLSDHTVSDSCVPKEVAGFWVRMFGPECLFTMNFTLWSAEVNRKGTGNCYFPFKDGFLNEDFYNLQKLDEIHIQFGNKLRKSKKSVAAAKKSSIHKKTVLEKPESLTIIDNLRVLRDNGKVAEFDARSIEIVNAAKKINDIDQELIVILEKSMCLCYQGNVSESKRLLQKAVHLSSKSSCTLAVKNRAYLYLASIHVNDGNFGTAQECLGMLTNEHSNSMSLEDLELRALLHGVIMMNFGERISNMSQNLWHEAMENFEKALEWNKQNNYEEKMEDSRCVIHIWMAKLYLAMLKSVCFPGCKMPDLENKVIEQLTIFENIYANKLSNRSMIFGLLVKAEYYIFLLKPDAASSVIEAINDLIRDKTRLYFNEMKALNKLKQLQESNETKEKDSDVDLFKKVRDLLVNSDSESGYTADNSSSDEKIEFAAEKYQQTTYV